MDTQSLKLVLESLIATVREQHLQIQGSYGLLTKFRACFEPDVAEKIDVLVKEGAIQDLTSLPYRDGTTARLDELLRQVRNS